MSVIEAAVLARKATRLQGRAIFSGNSTAETDFVIPPRFKMFLIRMLNQRDPASLPGPAISSRRRNVPS